MLHLHFCMLVCFMMILCEAMKQIYRFVDGTFKISRASPISLILFPLYHDVGCHLYGKWQFEISVEWCMKSFTLFWHTQRSAGSASVLKQCAERTVRLEVPFARPRFFEVCDASKNSLWTSRALVWH